MGLFGRKNRTSTETHEDGDSRRRFNNAKGFGLIAVSFTIIGSGFSLISFGFFVMLFSQFDELTAWFEKKGFPAPELFMKWGGLALFLLGLFIVGWSLLSIRKGFRLSSSGLNDGLNALGRLGNLTAMQEIKKMPEWAEAKHESVPASTVDGLQSILVGFDRDTLVCVAKIFSYAEGVSPHELDYTIHKMVTTTLGCRSFLGHASKPGEVNRFWKTRNS